MAEHLTGDRLTTLAASCWAELQIHPASCFVIHQICNALISEYDGQAIAEERYQQVDTVLGPVLTSVLAHPDDLAELSHLVLAFASLMENA